MNARVLIAVVVAAVVASLATVGVLALFVVAFLTFARFEARRDAVLPSSEFAQPAGFYDEIAVSIHVTGAGTVVIGDRKSSVTDAPSLILEQMEPLDEGQSVADVTLYIVADENTSSGVVQELIEACQAVGFERFSLRAAQ